MILRLFKWYGCIVSIYFKRYNRIHKPRVMRLNFSKITAELKSDFNITTRSRIRNACIRPSNNWCRSYKTMRSDSWLLHYTRIFILEFRNKLANNFLNHTSYFCTIKPLKIVVGNLMKNLISLPLHHNSKN